MRKLWLIGILFLVGCQPVEVEVQYKRSASVMELNITHKANGTCIVRLTKLDDVKKYRKQLNDVLKELDDFEVNLIASEKMK